MAEEEDTDEKDRVIVREYLQKRRVKEERDKINAMNKLVKTRKKKNIEV